MLTNCGDVCEAVIKMVRQAGFELDDCENHDDILDALEASTLIPNNFHVPPESAYKNDSLLDLFQVDTEEDIASIVFEFQDHLLSKRGGPEGVFDEEDCSELGRRIFLWVAKQLRPDFFDKFEIVKD